MTTVGDVLCTFQKMEIDATAEMDPIPSGDPRLLCGPSDEVEEEEIVALDPDTVEAPPRRRRKGIGLSFLFNTLTLGLGAWATVSQWDRHITKLSFEFITGTVVGAGTGLLATRKYKNTKRLKARKKQILNFQYGTRELNVLMKNVPYWLDFSGVERMQYFNRLIREMWRFYDTAICKQIVEMVEPLLMQHKPIFIKSIRFKKLTFGGAPFKMTHVSILKEDVDGIVLEVGTRWDGAACVAIGIEIQGAGTISPAVRRLNFFANVRLGLTRMVPKFPGFGAMLISLQRPPLVTFDIDCGGGIGELIEAWLIPFLKNDVLGNGLVWPNRIVVPLLPREVIGPLEGLRLRTQGVLKVRAIEAQDLPKSDVIGKGDPFVLLETVAFNPSRTKTIFNTQNPYWNEVHFLKVQEIDQSLRVTVRDQESAIVGALTLQTSELQGQALIPIEDLPMGEPVDQWYDLGKGDWGDVGGPGQGCGRIHLELCYYTLDALREGQFKEQSNSTIPRGLVFVTVISGNNLRSSEGANAPNPYCKVWLCEIPKQTRSLKQTRDPVWNESMDWANVDIAEYLYVEVYDRRSISDRLLGKGRTPIITIAKEFSQGKMHRPVECTMELESGRGDVILMIEWVPLDKNPLPMDQFMIKTRSIIDSSPRGILFLNLISGEDLKNVDLFGLSDPYCIVKIGGSQKLSKYINNTLNPVWKELFSWSGVRETAVLYIEVMDKGSYRDTSLGICELPIAPALQPMSVVHPFTLLLRSAQPGESAKGRINLQLCWKPWRRDADEPRPEEPKWTDFEDVAVDE